MSLKPSNYALIVEPSLVDNDEEETASGLHVVRESRPQRKVWRGVVRLVGDRVNQPIGVGHVAHYTDFVEVEGVHVVPEAHLLAWDDDE